MRVHPHPGDVMTAFERLKDNPSFAESAAVVRGGGLPVEMLQAMSLRPELLAAFAQLSGAVYPGGILERRLKELVILESSRRNACQFCVNSHVAMVRLEQIADDPLGFLDAADQHTPRETLALEYTRAAMADSNRVSEALFARLRDAFSEPEIVELTMLIGMINMLNLFNNCLHVRYHDDYHGASPASG